MVRWRAWILVVGVTAGLGSLGISEASAETAGGTSDEQVSEEEGGGPIRFRSVYVGAGTGFQLGVDFFVIPGQRFGADAFVWRDPVAGGCEPTCYRRTEFRAHWTFASSRRLINGGVMIGLAGGRFHDRVSKRDTRTGIYIGPLLGFRGSYTPSPGFGIGANVGINPSYYAGRERIAAPEPSAASGFRFGLSGALVLEFGNPRSPGAGD